MAVAAACPGVVNVKSVERSESVTLVAVPFVVSQNAVYEPASTTATTTMIVQTQHVAQPAALQVMAIGGGGAAVNTEVQR